ncbi:unnamed protein product [Spirodela intermedia]|uniref:Uncharacterized protein n=1 Tax=Spirodela intermedia TaxID=51605 RepID=A0A7I8IGC6_SPIIN|nr:unnamed protein product [Spirodela intermedia]CAA6656929.1 unnamed protein product [Spirodela intermedia]
MQLNALAFASDSGKLLAWVSGVAVVYLPLWAVLLVGAALGLVGYGVQFLLVGEALASASYWQVFLLSATAGNAACWINTACYEVCLRNFRSKARVAIGLSTSYFGLSAVAYTVLADAFIQPLPHQKAKAYLLLNAVVPVATTLLVLPIARVVLSEDKQRSDGGFILVFVIAMASGACGVFGSLWSMSTWVMLSFGCLLAALLAVKVEEGLASPGGWEEAGEDRQVAASAMVRTPEFWLYFFGYLFGGRWVPRALQNLCCGLSGFAFGFFGRCMVSLVDFVCIRYVYEVPRPALIAALTAPMAGSFFLLLNSGSACLYAGNVVIGTCTGAITSAAASATTELFGTKFFGINHNIVVSNIPIGSFLFGFLAAFVYQRGENGRGVCMGAQCYERTFLVWGCLCAVSTLLFVVLHIRTRKTRSVVSA